ncbi:unnamed protein product [Auanema sp. JU1783]|nr:unnamed protein product [Auanema sp. JU1783]
MQEIDLGDRSGLIDLIYGPSKDTISTASVNTLTPLTETVKEKKEKKEKKDKREKKERREKSKVSCSFCSAFILFLLACLAILLAAYVGHWYTRMEFEKHFSMVQYVPQARRNLSDLNEVFYEEEEIDTSIPTAAELKLPGTFIPIWYNATIRSYLPGYGEMEPSKNLTTEGHLLVKLRAESEANQIVLNAHHLTFPKDLGKIQLFSESSKKVRRAASSQNETVEADDDSNLIKDMAKANESSDSEIKTKKQKIKESKPMMESYTMLDNKIISLVYNETLQKVVLTLSTAVNQGEEVILKLPFGGKIDDSLNGLYTNVYSTKNGEKRFIAVTHLQPTYARKLLPCLDEPHLKAVWKLSIIHPNGTVARSNSDVEKEYNNEDGWTTTSFFETSPISSYLLGMTITDFESVKTTSSKGAEIRIWCRPELLNSTQYALDNVPKIIDAIEAYYGIEMPFKKQDIFAIPAFEAGAMENPGIIMFRESRLLVDPLVDDARQKEIVLRSLAHELSHQWFGNLVTLSGWDSLWLNEAFARQMEYSVVEKVLNGKLNEHEHEVAISLEHALARDCQSSSHPLTVPIETASDAYEIFDMITYEKGAAIVRMIKQVLGEETFRKGIQNYLNENKFGSANYTKLWSSLNQVVPNTLLSWNEEKFDVSDFANKWILQMGYPILDIYRIDSKTVEITQRRFKIDNLTPEKAKYRNALYWYKWDVPLFAEVNGKKQDMVWLHEATRLPLNLTDVLVVNPESYGYYRVNYDEAGWDAFAKQLSKDHMKLSTLSRGRILSDAFALASASQLSYETVFNLTSYITKETEYLPTKIALEGLVAIFEKVADEDHADEMKNLILSRVEGLYGSIDLQTVSTADETKLLELKRKLSIVGAYCKLKPSTCKKNFDHMFEKQLLAVCSSSNQTSDCSKVPSSMRGLVYCYGLSKGDEETFDLVQKYAQNEISAGERVNLMSALGCSRIPSKLKKLLRDSVIKRDGIITKSDIQTVVSSMNTHDVGNLIVTNYIVDNWKEITEKLSDDRDILSMLLRSGLSVKNERELSQIQHFISDHPQSTRGFSAFRTSMETARTTINWNKKNKNQLSSYFDDKEQEMDEDNKKMTASSRH